MEPKQEQQQAVDEREARRQFLARCGRFAAITPPAMTMLLTVATTPNEAYASTILGGPKKPRTPRKPKKK